MGSLFSVKLAPGVRISASSRGLRTHVGPRGARVHVGGGRTGVSTGAGPFTYYTSGSSARRSSSRSGSTAATSRQVAAAARAQEKQEQADALRAAFDAIDRVHLDDFEAATAPTAPPPPPIDIEAVRAHHAREARRSTSVFKRAERRAALAFAESAAADEIARLHADHAEHQRRWQAALDESWARLNANDPEMVMAVLNEAFADNEAAATAVAVDGAEAQLLVLVPPLADVPERKPTTTDAGNLSLKKLTKTERAGCYAQLVAGYTLVTAKEAFAVAPALASATVAAVRIGDSGQAEAVLAARFERACLRRSVVAAGRRRRHPRPRRQRDPDQHRGPDRRAAPHRPGRRAGARGDRRRHRPRRDGRRVTAPEPLPPGLYEALLTEQLGERAQPSTARRRSAASTPPTSRTCWRATSTTSYAGCSRAPRMPTAASSWSTPCCSSWSSTRTGSPTPPSSCSGSRRPPGWRHRSGSRGRRRPLTDAALLTNAHGEPTLGAELRAEIDTADEVDLLCAFVKWHGLRLLETAARPARATRGVPLRVITTTYMGATERRALDRLVARLRRRGQGPVRRRAHPAARQGVDVPPQHRLRHGVRRLLEPLARRPARRASSGTSGCRGAATPALMEKFRATFDTYWNDRELRALRPGPRRATGSTTRWLEASRRPAAATGSPSPCPGLEVRPYPYQQEMLDALEAERAVHGRHRNLVVAATGTGKTVVAALDYRGLCERAAASGRRCSSSPTARRSSSSRCAPTARCSPTPTSASCTSAARGPSAGITSSRACSR